MQKQTLLAMVGLLALGCDGGDEKKLTVGTGSVGDCSLSFANIADTEWLFLKVNADKTEAPDPKSRLKFVKDGAGLTAKYTAGSLTEVYDYACTEKGEELICAQPANVKNWCLAVIANGEECTAETLRKEAPEITDEAFAKGKAEADAEYAKYKGTPQEAQFKAQFGNMGNALRGVLYVKVDAKKCRLRVQDMYKFYYQGKWGEDSNPNGINPFVKNEAGALLWETCTNVNDLVDLREANFPSDPANVRNMMKHPAGTEVHYWFLPGEWVTPQEGCTYSYDVYYNWAPAQKGVTPEKTEDGKLLKWHFAKKYETASALDGAEVIHFAASKTCAGKEPEKVVACNAVRIE